MSDTSPQKALVRLFYHEMWNKADKRRIPEIFHPEFTFRGSLGPVLTGHEEFAAYVDDVTGALGEFVCEILELTEEGDRVVAKMLFHGRHRAAMFGFPPTGRRVEWHGSAHFSFKEGKVSDLWVLGDVHGLIKQLESKRR
ncbi:MAG: ester cyclase [Gammaproteobacteria bacterium]|nr:ester cyclase [Gammaproteobacteria bacterium]